MRIAHWRPVAARWLLALTTALALSACVTDPNAPLEPGSEKWYVQRMQEIETAKAEGKLTDEQYISLKNEADATRAARINASRYSGPSNFWFDGYH